MRSMIDSSSFILEALRRYWLLLVAWPAVAAAIYLAVVSLWPPTITAALDIAHPSSLANAMLAATEDLPEGVEIYRDGETRTVLTAAGSNAERLNASMDLALSRLRAVADVGEAKLPEEKAWSTYIKGREVLISNADSMHTGVSTGVWTLFGTLWLMMFFNSLRRP